MPDGVALLGVAAGRVGGRRAMTDLEPDCGCLVIVLLVVAIVGAVLIGRALS